MANLEQFMVAESSLVRVWADRVLNPEEKVIEFIGDFAHIAMERAFGEHTFGERNEKDLTNIVLQPGVIEGKSSTHTDKLHNAVFVQLPRGQFSLKQLGALSAAEGAVNLELVRRGSRNNTLEETEQWMKNVNGIVLALAKECGIEVISGGKSELVGLGL